MLKIIVATLVVAAIAWLVVLGAIYLGNYIGYRRALRSTPRPIDLSKFDKKDTK